MEKKMGKKGVSAIIVTVIMIVIVLAAIGVVWIIVQNILEQSTSDIDLGTKCLGLNLIATKLNCSATTTCDVTIKKSGGEDFDGLKLVFSNRTSGNIGSVQKVLGNIALLDTKKISAVAHGLTSGKPDTVEVSAYFLDTNGKEQVCSQGKKFEF